MGTLFLFNLLIMINLLFINPCKLILPLLPEHLQNYFLLIFLFPINNLWFLCLFLLSLVKFLLNLFRKLFSFLLLSERLWTAVLSLCSFRGSFALLLLFSHLDWLIMKVLVTEGKQLLKFATYFSAFESLLFLLFLFATFKPIFSWFSSRINIISWWSIY